MRLALALLALCTAASAQADKLAATYAKEVDKLNAAHARKPEGTEAELAQRLPKKALQALDDLLALDVAPDVAEALVAAGEAALDLDRGADFARVRARLSASPEQAARLGTALSRPRFVLRGLGGLDEAYLERFAGVLDAVLAGYDDVFGFRELSKVPGKKLRVRVHLEPAITSPPHFAPQFPYHSEIDFPVVDRERLTSPTEDGKFLFYGLCHELGHVVAMWGDGATEEDHHVWAHYTGAVVCQRVSEQHAGEELFEPLRDARWRNQGALEEECAGAQPGRDTREGVTALFLALHEELGPRALGDALNHLDALDQRMRRNGVRYYTLRELEQGLLATQKDKARRKRVEELFR